jgi:hypothetical protein
MSISPKEASDVLGVPVETIRKWQDEKWLPDPIPDDHFDTVIDFRIRLEQAARKRYDRLHGTPDAQD